MAKQGALVSVVVPVWNTQKCVGKLIKELLGQTYRNIEIIAVDDGSSDNSLQVLQDLAKQDGRLHVIHQENAGASAARNTGIEAAHGKYVVFADSDDEVVEDFVEKLVGRMEADANVALVVTGMRDNKLYDGSSVDLHITPRRQRRERERLADYLLELLLRDGRMYGVLNKIFRLEMIKEFNLRFEVGRDFAEDTKFVLDYLEHAPGKIEFILEPLYIYNFGTDTSTVRKSSTIWKNWQKSYDDLENWAQNVSGGKIHLKTKFLLELVLMRWRVSHCRAKKRAQMA